MGTIEMETEMGFAVELIACKASRGENTLSAAGMNCAPKYWNGVRPSARRMECAD